MTRQRSALHSRATRSNPRGGHHEAADFARLDGRRIGGGDRCHRRAGADTGCFTVALGASVTSIDPHFHNLAPNSNVAFHIFGTLIQQDTRQRLLPGLAQARYRERFEKLLRA